MRQAFGIGVVLGVAGIAAACTSVLGDFEVGGAGTGSTGGPSGCPVGTADCDGNPADCEVNVSDDPQNCGACGARCLDDGTCAAGVCDGVTEIARGYPTMESPNAKFLVIYGDEVYWTAGEGRGGSVQKVSVLGGPVTTIAADQNAPYGIAVNQGGVFWSNLNDTNILRVNHDEAGAPKVVFDSDYATLGVVADETDVFWAQRAGGIGAPGRGSLIGRIPMSDGLADDAFHEDSAVSPHLIALDDTHVYWVDRSERGSVNKTSREDGQTARLIENPQAYPYAIAVDRDHVYWTNSPRDRSNDERGGVMRAPKRGARDATRLWSPDEDRDIANSTPDCIAVDDNDDFVYWTDQGSSRVLRKRKDGSGRQEVLYERGTPRGIALHGDHVYWVDEKNNGAVRKIRR
ncbi:lipoprotein receptor [Sorangium sp. So ce1335]|uniref:lipoprotein receptor n=1 Tax=Sorangium sp. So ce1335 TaxID=3133335 RepID=UPI003F61DD2A